MSVHVISMCDHVCRCVCPYSCVCVGLRLTTASFRIAAHTNDRSLTSDCSQTLSTSSTVSGPFLLFFPTSSGVCHLFFCNNWVVTIIIWPCFSSSSYKPLCLKYLGSVCHCNFTVFQRLPVSGHSPLNHVSLKVSPFSVEPILL